jgi:hypothetical protein
MKYFQSLCFFGESIGTSTCSCNWLEQEYATVQSRWVVGFRGYSGGPAPEVVPRSPEMTERPKERWRELCDQAIREKDLQRVLELANEISDLLETKEGPRRQEHGLDGKPNGEA